MKLIFWWPFAAAALHIVEEFLWPGGFREWDRRYRPAIRTSITPRFHLIVNAALLVLCLQLTLPNPERLRVALWLGVSALLASNAVYHLAGAVRTREYSPGMVTGTLLYIPMAVFGFVHFTRSGRATAPVALLAALVGGSYHLWASIAHRYRARTSPSVNK